MLLIHTPVTKHHDHSVARYTVHILSPSWHFITYIKLFKGWDLFTYSKYVVGLHSFNLKTQIEQVIENLKVQLKHLTRIMLKNKEVCTANYSNISSKKQILQKGCFTFVCASRLTNRFVQMEHCTFFGRLAIEPCLAAIRVEGAVKVWALIYGNIHSKIK